ncbi:PKD domain-containing protein, partial [bacterium]|nr:PKD domain-containing protein [bacterium]
WADGLIVRNSTFRVEEGSYADCAIFAIGGLTIIEGNLLIGSGNAAKGIYVDGSGSAVRSNVVLGFSEGIYCAYLHEGEVAGNLVYGCGYVGIEARSSGTSVLGNTVTGCGSTGILTYGGVVSNNISTGNGIGVTCYDYVPIIEYNDVWGNGTDFSGSTLPPSIGDLITTNANGDSCDAYFNIFFDPLFVGVDDYHLQVGSACIDAGDPDSTYYDPDGTIADIGAYPYYQGTPAPPEVDFAPSGTYGVSPYPVQFTPTNTGGPITTWSWSFGDGGASGIADPVHVYMVSDTTTFTVALTVEGPGGADVVVYPDLITVLPAQVGPYADFTAEPLTGYGPVQFTDLSIGHVDSWEWSFGNGDSSSQQHPYYEYADPGTYTVTLTVTGPYGSDLEEKLDYIVILPPETVFAGFEASPETGVAPLPVWFTNTTAGTVIDFSWDFGDSATSGEVHPVHVYTDPGSFEVVLVATGVANSDTATALIEVLRAEPVITSITDVPDDQGGQCYLQFSRSGHDTDGIRSAETYTVERRDDAVWTAVASGTAYGQDHYQYLVPTLVDSTPSDPGLAEFRVIAGMEEGNFASDPAWGYSVDNVAPAVPSALSAAWEPGLVVLSWSPNAEEDFAYYAVFRDTTEGFEAGEFVGFTADEWFEDGDPLPAPELWYRVTAWDTHGNESDPSSPASPEGTGVEDELPASFRLGSAVPNPFNPVTTISYWVPEHAAGTEVELAVYDIGGRLVRTLVHGPTEPGRRAVAWDGRDNSGAAVSSGVYLYRLEAEGYEAVRKAVLLK